MTARIARTRKQLSRVIGGGVTCITLIATAVTGQTNTGTRGTIDLNAGTLNGRPLGAWTLSEITEEFGRPSSVSPGISGITGPQLYYHPQGLEFWLRPIEKDSAQHVWILTLHLAREWDSDHSSWYSIFQGKLVPAVDANWNQSRLLKEFSSRTPVVETADEYNQKLKAGGFPSTLHGATTDAVHFDAGGTKVHFAIEPITKFVERFTLEVTGTPK